MLVSELPPTPRTAFNYFAYYCVLLFDNPPLPKEKLGRTHYKSRDEEPESLATGAVDGERYLFRMEHKQEGDKEEQNRANATESGESIALTC